jgi:hypothetical protein
MIDNESQSARIPLDVPANIHRAAETLERYGLPTTHQHAVGILAAVLIGAAGPTCPPADSPALSLVRRLGRAFNEFGADEDEGWKYMQVAHAAARDLYGFDLSWLNVEWSGIGKWQA